MSGAGQNPGDGATLPGPSAPVNPSLSVREGREDKVHPYLHYLLKLSRKWPLLSVLVSEAHNVFHQNTSGQKKYP